MRKPHKYRKIYENNFGPIPSGWVIHHIDCDEENNTPLNLIALPENVHNKMHEYIIKYDKILTREEITSFLMKRGIYARSC